MKHKLFPGYLLLVILIGCSGSQQDTNDLKLEILTHEINSWVNLMPGSKPSFFISGSLIIESNENAVLDSVHLLKCEVTQQGKLLYVLHPDIKILDNMDLVNTFGRIFFFNLVPGTPIKKELNLEEPISIEFLLSAFNKVKQYKIDSIRVMKTY